jgi:hypothetical protein
MVDVCFPLTSLIICHMSKLSSHLNFFIFLELMFSKTTQFFNVVDVASETWALF